MHLVFQDDTEGRDGWMMVLPAGHSGEKLFEGVKDWGEVRKTKLQ